VEAIGGGAEGVIAGASAPSIRRALGRLAAQIPLTRPGTTTEAARDAIAESFDLAVEVARLPDGRTRVQRVAEIELADEKALGAKDIFVLAPDGGGDSGFLATGVVPRVDAAIFRKR
jgi:pilus assembly protein CpaF